MKTKQDHRTKMNGRETAAAAKQARARRSTQPPASILLIEVHEPQPFTY